MTFPGLLPIEKAKALTVLAFRRSRKTVLTNFDALDSLEPELGQKLTFKHFGSTECPIARWHIKNCNAVRDFLP